MDLHLHSYRWAKISSKASSVPQVTLWNFVRYNVVGGGDSSLYGVESSTFYLRNAFTNLNLVLLLALLAPLSAIVLMLQRRGAHVLLPGKLHVSNERPVPHGQAGYCNCFNHACSWQHCMAKCMYCLTVGKAILTVCAGTGVRIRLAIAVVPVWVWGLAISLLPHKEERFLYPVYPLVGEEWMYLNTTC